MSADGPAPMLPATLASVELQHVSCAHGDVHAVFRLSATLHTGDVVAVLGPNGAGKSTLLTLLTTLRAPDEGRILFNGRLDSRRQRLKLRPHIGVVSHESMVNAQLTGRENLRFTAALYGVSAAVADDWLQRVGLTEAADRLAGTYSRGMRQRLSVARALLSSPSLVLFDEPLTGLDRAGQAFFWGVVQQLRDAGRLVVIVTHDFDLPPVVNRLWIMERGRLRHDAPFAGDVSEAWLAVTGQPLSVQPQAPAAAPAAPTGTPEAACAG